MTAAQIFSDPDRRTILKVAAILGLAAPVMAKAAGTGFNGETVERIARDLARRPFVADAPLPPLLAELSYDDYRDIRFDRRQALWAGEGRIIAEPMLRGFLARDRVEIFDVEDGAARSMPFDPKAFDFGKRGVTAPDDPAIGFSGLRFLGPLNHPDVPDEIAVFQGASYFRSLGRRQLYGISARGLALGTGGPAEEFPLFRRFWLERPREGTILVHALLDGPSVTGAYHITIRPGDETVMEIDARIYPRTSVGAPGVAPMSSMFLFGPASRRRFDDFRRAVHDSDGLEMWTGAGERLWRPINNPATLAVSAFADENPRGFGLMQRAQGFADYGDLEALYDRRPSLWVEPIGGWGAGSVQLVEIPAADETGDNVACFWRPRVGWWAGQDIRVRYRLHWGRASSAPADIARVVATRTGATVIGDRQTGMRHFAIDFDGPGLTDGGSLRPRIAASTGALSEVRLQALPGSKILRASFDLKPSAETSELRLVLESGGKAVSETWLNRWAA